MPDRSRDKIEKVYIIYIPEFQCRIFHWKRHSFPANRTAPSKSLASNSGRLNSLPSGSCLADAKAWFCESMRNTIYCIPSEAKKLIQPIFNHLYLNLSESATPISSDSPFTPQKTKQASFTSRLACGSSCIKMATTSYFMKTDQRLCTHPRNAPCPMHQPPFQPIPAIPAIPSHLKPSHASGIPPWESLGPPFPGRWAKGSDLSAARSSGCGSASAPSGFSARRRWRGWGAPESGATRERLQEINPDGILWQPNSFEK